jgi:chemotaxis methyl-accepting protein methylase
MSLLDDPAFTRVTRHLERLGAGAISLYKTACLERRLASRLRARGQSTLAAYAALLDRDEAERARLLSTLAVGVTSFFRNPSMWRRLAELVGPRLRSGRTFHAWSAGCATGEEAWSIALLLDSLAGAAGDPWRVTATDLDRASLEVARAGRYPATAAAAIEAVIARTNGTAQPRGFELSARVRDRVAFSHDDLVVSRPRGPFDLVVCRNVLIHFADQGRALALEELVRSLSAGGLLVLGRTEAVGVEARGTLAVEDGRERIYRRIG